MPLVDIAAITGRAAWVREKAGLTGHGPPYSTHTLFEAFPDIKVAGADLPRGVLEMAERGPGRRVLWYQRRASAALQRVALAHGLHHFLTDLRRKNGVRECNAAQRDLELAGKLAADPIEIACDLFAGELLVPFAVLDRAAPALLFPPGAEMEATWHDQVDALASLFNAPSPFVLWRLHDLQHLRQTHFYVR